ncbi:hypothetical protein F2P81_012152 [Scophthalmus maximus]|uniref:Uncharacterized protein n=1 Tax=Scophthalmus maximus TaxID=52904 RepID=A0A6A4STM9_SCOMX|nr:hypothetical protein F2P81_012152 [Scophthalmus maximus]
MFFCSESEGMKSTDIQLHPGQFVRLQPAAHTSTPAGRRLLIRSKSVQFSCFTTTSYIRARDDLTTAPSDVFFLFLRRPSSVG